MLAARGALDLRELDDEPLVSFTLILHEGVAVCVQYGRCFLGLLVTGNDLGPIFGQRKVVPFLLA